MQAARTPSPAADSRADQRSVRVGVKARCEAWLKRQTSETSGAARAQLARVLASETFARAKRLIALLRFVVEETVEGRGDSIKEQVIGAELYRKHVGFEPARDPVVRVDARRLRDKLREYYESEGAADPIRVDIPKG